MDGLTGRLALFAEVAKTLDPDLEPVRVTLRERIRCYWWLWRLR